MKEDLQELLSAERPLLVSPDAIISIAQPLGVLLSRVESLTQIIQEHVKETRKNKKASTRDDSLKNTLERGVSRDEKLKAKVYVRVVILRLAEIDTVKERFSADVYVEAKWREPSLDQASTETLGNFISTNYWNPRLYIDNALGDPKETIWHKVTLESDGATVYEKRRIKGMFAENMELLEFPFDTQELNIHVKSDRNEAEVELACSESDISAINVQTFIDQQQWRLQKSIDMKVDQSMVSMEKPMIAQPGLTATCRASRRPGFFLWNIMAFILFIGGLSFAPFSVDIMETSPRLKLSFTLVLTMITFKYTVSSSLPKVSYLTYLDKYVLVSMWILSVGAGWHGVVAVMGSNLSEDTARKWDYVILIALAILYILFHIIFICSIYISSVKKRRRILQKDSEYQEKLEKVLGLYRDVDSETTTNI